MADGPWMSVDEAAAAFGITSELLIRLTRPAPTSVNFGGRILYSRRDVEWRMT